MMNPCTYILILECVESDFELFPQSLGLLAKKATVEILYFSLQMLISIKKLLPLCCYNHFRLRKKQ